MKKKTNVVLLWIFAVICWLETIVPAGYVLIEAVKSMDGTLHGFNGEMLYGIDAFIDTILSFVAFLFPLFILWSICLLGAIIFTVLICVHYVKRNRTPRY